MPIEESGNLLILAYMYQVASGDTAWAHKYSALFATYANYLSLNGLRPTTQLSTDDGAGSSPNQTNLAIKAAIALNAYGLMTGQSNYSDTGKRFATELYNNTLGTDPNRTHFTILEGEAQTWALAFNLFPDVLLGLNTFPTAAYAMQTAFYSTIRSLGGVALDSREDWGKTDWMLWAAATAMAPGVGNNSCRDMFIDDVWNFASNGMNEVPFGDKFFVETNGTDVEGMWDMYEARPVVGGHFALLAMQGHGILT